MLKPLITIENWDGGQSLNDRIAAKNQLAIGSGIDPFLRRGYMANKVALTRMTLSSSVDTNVEFQDIIYAQEDSNVYLAGEDTIIYSQSSAGAIASAHDSAQAGAIRSLREYKGYMYYPQDTTIGRSDLAGSPTYTDNWQASNISNVAYKPIEVSGGDMFVGNGQYVAKWDGTTFTYNALDIQTGWEIQSMANFGSSLLAIGANFGDTSNSVYSKIFLWSRQHPTIWDDEIEVPEANIFAMISRPGGLWYFAGTNNLSLYFCPLGSRQGIKVFTFENDFPELYMMMVYPNAISAKDGRIYFGLTFNTSATNQFTPGVYSFNPDINNLKMQCERATNAGSTGLVNIKSLRSIKYASQPQMVYFSYERGTTQNLYREQLFSSDTTIYAGNGEFTNGTSETVYFDAPQGKKIRLTGFGMDFLPLTTGSQIDLEYKKDYDTSFTAIKTYTTVAGINFHKPLVVECYSIKFRITVSGTNSRQFFKRLYANGSLIDMPQQR